jgi:hypothetical protein
MVDEVVDYCHVHLLFDELLPEVKASNPKQYARFEAQLGGPQVLAGQSASAQDATADHQLERRGDLGLRESERHEEIRRLRTVLSVERKSLSMTLEQKAKYGIDVPIRLLHQENDIRQRIETLEGEIEKLERGASH